MPNIYNGQSPVDYSAPNSVPVPPAPIINATVTDIIKTTNTTPATSTTTGALQIAGGGSIAGNLYVGGNTVAANVTVTNTLSANRNAAVGGNLFVIGKTFTTGGIYWAGNGAIYSSATGFTGSIGATGPAGTAGGVGFTGSRGFVGSAGFTGSIGATGPAGFVGSVGNAGFTGSRGFVGSAGFTGSVGANGFTGSVGVGYTGSAGYNGSIGSPGVTPGLKYAFTAGAGTLATSGNIRFNNSTIASTTTIYIGATDSAGANAGPYIGQWGDSTNPLVKGQIVISFNSQIATVSSVWNVSNTPTFFATPAPYYAVPVTYVSGTAPVQATALILEFARTGDQGNRGPIGYTGSTGAVGNTGDKGYTGSTGEQGIQGTVGYTGSVSTVPGYTGSTGVSGGFRYNFNTVTTPASIPSGNIRFNNTNISSVTNLYISTTDAAAAIGTLYLSQLGDSTNAVKGYLVFNTVSNVTSVGVVSSVFAVTGVPTLGGSAPLTYYTVPVTYVSGSNSPSNLTQLMMQFIRAGDAGNKGYTGSVGSGYTGSRGDLGYTGSQGDQGPIGYTGSSGSIIEPVATGVTTATMPANFTPDYTVGTLFQYALTANFALKDPINMPIGSSITVILTQNAGGNVVMTPSANILFTGSKTLSATAYAIDMINIMKVQSVFAGNNVSNTVFIGSMSKGYGSV